MKKDYLQLVTHKIFQIAFEFSKEKNYLIWFMKALQSLLHRNLFVHLHKKIH